MAVFGEYAGFYDALYRDKDYAAECAVVEGFFEKYSASKVKSILDLGCGTGGHACLFAKRGYEVIGMDASKEMLDIAVRKAAEGAVKAEFRQGDVRSFDMGRKVDAAVAMFAVTGYQTGNDDVESMFSCVRRHLEKGGLFIFDVWHGPAVLSVKPESRSKEFMVNGEKVVRTATPSIDAANHVVEVGYTIASGGKTVAETHRMRFFFPQELRYFLKKAGFETLEISPFMKPGEAAGMEDWNITVVARGA